MLLKLVFLASLRSRSENSRQIPIDRSRTSGCSILLSQPMNWVARRRGMRLVSRKLRSSCRADLAMRSALSSSCKPLLHRSASRWIASSRHFALYALGAAALAASLGKVKTRLATVAGPSTARSKAMPACRAGSRRWFRSTNTTRKRIFRADDAPAEVAARRRAASRGSPSSIGSDSPKTAALTAEVAGRRVRPAIHRRLSGAVPVQPDRARESEERRRSCNRRAASW